MSFPQNVADAALIACGRSCCICHKFCGTKIELHHIRQVANGGEDTLENCIPLCFDCHSEMGKADPKHPKGKRYSEKELIGHRDRWFETVKQQSGKNEDINEKLKDALICDDDKMLFEEICEAFTAQIKHSIREPNFYNPYDGRTFIQLEFLLDNSNDPFFVFLNPRIEESKQELIRSVKEFTSYLYHNVYYIGEDRPEMVATYSWLLYHEYLHPEQFGKSIDVLVKEFQEITETINSYARKTWDAYLSFVLTCRSIFSGI